MTEVIAASSMLTLVMAAIAIAVVWGVLRLLDRAAGFDFRGWIHGQQKDLATAVYLGLRFVGACFLVGQLFS